MPVNCSGGGGGGGHDWPIELNPESSDLFNVYVQSLKVVDRGELQATENLRDL